MPQAMARKLDENINVVSEISDDTLTKIKADDIRLSQVLSNLVDNAVRFIERGQITIKTYNKASAAGEGKFLTIAIQDTGIGIAEADLDVIVECFRQVDGSVTRRKGSAGLGLAISYDLIELMGVELTVTSTLDVSTIFEFHLPLKR